MCGPFCEFVDLLLVFVLVLAIIWLLNVLGVINWFPPKSMVVHVLIILAVIALVVWALGRVRMRRRKRMVV